MYCMSGWVLNIRTEPHSATNSTMVNVKLVYLHARHIRCDKGRDFSCNGGVKYILVLFFLCLKV